MISFLNLIDLDSGRQVRLAEFGFYAESPSFCGDDIVFYRDGKCWRFDSNSGAISAFDDEIPEKCEERSSVKLNFISEIVDGIGHCELLAGGKVAVRFMGSERSIGAVPEKNGKVVFIGYPSPNGMN